MVKTKRDHIMIDDYTLFKYNGSFMLSHACLDSIGNWETPNMTISLFFPNAASHPKF